MFVFASLFRYRFDGGCSKAAKLAERLAGAGRGGLLGRAHGGSLRALALGFLGICEIWLRRPAARAISTRLCICAQGRRRAPHRDREPRRPRPLELGQGGSGAASELARTAVDAAESGGLERSAQAVQGYTASPSPTTSGTTSTPRRRRRGRSSKSRSRPATGSRAACRPRRRGHLPRARRRRDRGRLQRLKGVGERLVDRGRASAARDVREPTFAARRRRGRLTSGAG